MPRVRDDQHRRRHSGAAVSVVLALCLSCVCNTAMAGSVDGDRINAIADLLSGEQFAAAAVLIDQHLLDNPDDAVMQYNAACARAQIGDIDAAEMHLRAAVKHGFLRFSLMKRDPDLRPMRHRAVYQSIIAARDAADGILAGRRNEQWLDRLTDGPYRLTRDRQRNIDVISDCDDAGLQQVRQRVATIADTLEAFFNQQLQQRVTIVFLSRDEAGRLFSNERIRGNYRHERRELIVTDLGRSLQHELTHAFHHAHMDAIGQDHPIWVQEGIACLFEAYDVNADGTIAFLPNDRQTMMRHFIERNTFDGGWDDLLHCSTAQFKQDAHAYYPLARSVMEYLAAHGSVERWYQRYIATFEHDGMGETALQAELDAPIAESELAWRLWVLSRDAPPATERSQNVPQRLATRRVSLPAGSSNAPSEADDDDGSRAIVLERSTIIARAKYSAIRGQVLAGEYEPVMATLREVIELDPDHADARYDLALGCISTGDINGAWEQYEKLAELNTNLARMVRACLKPRTTE